MSEVCRLRSADHSQKLLAPPLPFLPENLIKIRPQRVMLLLLTYRDIYASQTNLIACAVISVYVVRLLCGGWTLTEWTVSSLPVSWSTACASRSCLWIRSSTTSNRRRPGSSQTLTGGGSTTLWSRHLSIYLSIYLSNLSLSLSLAFLGDLWLYYLRQGGCVFTRVCLSVNKITQNYWSYLDETLWNSWT